MNIFHFEKVHKAVTKATVFASSVFMASDVLSQDATVEEVIVTAQKKSENLQNVPISVSTLSATELDNLNIKQINQSISHKNVFRGFHFQNKPHQQAKYIWVESGKIYDIIINIDSSSSYYKKSLVIELDSGDNKHLFVPKGFAHGFITLKPDSEIVYKCSDYYFPKAEGSIFWNDPDIKINWSKASDPICSTKDATAPLLKELESPFIYGENS